MEVTRVLYSLNLLEKLMVLHRHILFSLAVIVIAEAILMRTSAEQVPPLRRVALRYIKLVTSSNFWPFLPISALMLFVLLIMILPFSVLTSIPYACSVGEVSKSTIAAAQKIDVVGKSHVAWAFHRWR